MDHVGWGIIGTGDVAERKGGPALYLADRSELIAVASRTKSRAMEFAKRHGDPIVYDSAEALLRDERINAVYVATHPNTHAAYAEMAAAAGKHVLCEKPMAMTVEETQRMIDVCRDNRVSLSVAFYRREFPVIRKLKELLTAGSIGEILSVHVVNFVPFQSPDANPWRLDPGTAGGGILMDIGSHRFDLLCDFFGRPQSVFGQTAGQKLTSRLDDAAVVGFRFENNVLGMSSFQWNTPIARDDLEVVGTEGIVKIHDLSGSASLTLQRREGSEIWTFTAPDPVHLPFVEKLVQHLLDGAPNPCDGESGALPNEIIGQISIGGR